MIRSTVGFQPNRRAMPPTTPAITRSSTVRESVGLAITSPPRSRTLGQPVVDRGRHLLLRPAGDVDADVATAERHFGVVLAAHEVLQRHRGAGRNQVVILGVDVEHRHFDQPQVYFALADGDAAVDEAIALIELLDEL